MVRIDVAEARIAWEAECQSSGCGSANGGATEPVGESLGFTASYAKLPSTPVATAIEMIPIQWLRRKLSAALTKARSLSTIGLISGSSRQRAADATLVPWSPIFLNEAQRPNPSLGWAASSGEVRRPGWKSTRRHSPSGTGVSREVTHGHGRQTVRLQRDLTAGVGQRTPRRAMQLMSRGRNLGRTDLV